MIDQSLPFPCVEIPMLCWAHSYEEPDGYQGVNVDDYETDPFTLDLLEIIGLVPCGINKDQTTIAYLRGGNYVRALVPYIQMREMWFAAKATVEKRNLLTNNQ